MAPRKSGVSSWSTSMARPRSRGPPGLALLEAQVGGVPVVAVGDQRPGGAPARRRSRRAWSGVADRPDPVPLLGAVGELVVGRRGAVISASSARSVGVAAVHQQDRRRVEPHLGHPVGEVVGLRRVDPLVRQDRAVLGAGGSLRDVQGADEAADGDAAGRVLVQVERGLPVARDVALPLPAAQAVGDVPVGPRERARR